MPAATSPNPEPSADGHELLDDERLTALGLLLETSVGLLDTFAADLEPHGLSNNAFEVLLRLARSPRQRLRMTELAAQSTLTTSGLTRLVDRLVAAGQIVREPSPSDRRGTYAHITPTGLSVLLGAMPQHLDTIDRVLTGVLTPEELAILVGLLRRLRAVVKPGSDPEIAPPAP